MNNVSEEITMSFCIPTYNRADLVKQTIERILEYNGNQIEIVVVDNSSPDNTKESIESIRDARISYYRNDCNIGVVNNIIETIRLAKGQWVFTLSDEDFVSKDIVANLLHEVAKKEHENTAVILGNIKKSDGSYYDSSHEIYKYKNLIYTQGDEAIYQIGFNHKYLSGILIKKQCIPKNLFSSDVIRRGISPHVTFYTFACLNGCGATVDTDFCILGDANSRGSRSFVEKPNDKNYRHPENRFTQFVNFASIANKIVVGETSRISKILELYQYYLNESTHGWQSSISTQGSYFGESSKRKINLKAEAEHFHLNAISFFDNIIREESLKEILISRAEKRFKKFKRVLPLKSALDKLRPLRPFFSKLEPIIKPIYRFIVK